MGPRLRGDKREHPHPFDKLRAGSGILPSKEEGVERVSAMATRFFDSAALRSE